MKKSIVIPFMIGIGLLSVTGCGAANVGNQNVNNATSHSQTADTSTKQLSVLYAGSMTKVMEQKIGPQVDSQLGMQFKGEGKGSTALAQMIKSGLSQPDIFVSASPSADKLLMGSQNKDIVKWYLALARDQLVIAYSPKSRYKHQLNKAAKGQLPWYQVLEEKGFKLGRTDPLLDPKGKKTVFLFELAASYYHQPNLKTAIIGSDENPQQVFPEESLLARLTTGQVDAIIAYKHEAVEWGVPYITLPNQINLGSEKYAKEYAKATFTDKSGKVSKGAPIVFTITIPSTASNQKGAEQFVRYMLSGAGHQLLMKDGFLPIQTQASGNKKDVPTTLQSLIQRQRNS